MSEQVSEFKKSLDKALENEGELLSSSTLDVLEALKGVPMSHAILKATKIGTTVNSIKKKAPSGSDAAKLAKDMVAQWKSIAAGAKPGGASAKGGHSSAPTTATEVKQAPAAATSTSSSGNNIPLNALLPGRQKIVELLKQQLVQSMPVPAAMSLAIIIENGMNIYKSYEREQKDYHAKARQLVVNLKKNEELRKSLLSGDLDPSVLATMTVNELASEETKERRSATLVQGREAKQGDYFIRNQAELLENAGIDPNACGSLYVCRKKSCGSDKTQNYQLQTRSSDEPMTVFVTCLVCTSRYRC